MCNQHYDVKSTSFKYSFSWLISFCKHLNVKAHTHLMTAMTVPN